jgi:sarcosine oxidase/L-pipecolate oxidase
VNVFDRSQYDANGYDPAADDVQAASADHNKIVCVSNGGKIIAHMIQFRASYGKEIHYQRLALESRKAWVSEDEKRGFAENGHANDQQLFVSSGMLRIQPSDHLATLEKETLANMERDGLRDTQFVRSDPADCERAEKLGWKDKLLDFKIPESPEKSYEAVLDPLAGFVRCSNACAYYQKVAADKGVQFHFGSEDGAVESLVKVTSSLEPNKQKVVGLKTKSGTVYNAKTVVVAGKYFHIHLQPALLNVFKLDHFRLKFFPT